MSLRLVDSRPTEDEDNLRPLGKCEVEFTSYAIIDSGGAAEAGDPDDNGHIELSENYWNGKLDTILIDVVVNKGENQLPELTEPEEVATLNVGASLTREQAQELVNVLNDFIARVPD